MEKREVWVPEDSEIVVGLTKRQAELLTKLWLDSLTYEEENELAEVFERVKDDLEELVELEEE